jgi:colanic acid/amylovoran biosynthesis glycosyltransferase
VSTIAYVAGQFPLRSETFVYREVRELRRRGHEVVCVSLHPPIAPPADAEDLNHGRIDVYGRHRTATLAAAAAEIVRHPLRSLATFVRACVDALRGDASGVKARLILPLQAIFSLGLARNLRSRRVRHIHAHFAHAPATLAMYAAAQLGVPFSFTGHANDLFQRRILLRTKLRRASFVSCISRWHRAFYREQLDRDDEVYSIIRCGVDTAAFAPRLPVAGDRLNVLTVCRLVEKKGVDTLIKACHRLDPAGESWRLQIAGDGPQRDELERLVDTLHVRNAVTFLGAVENDRVRELLSTADVFALPCRIDSRGDKDGIPVVLMEAMAAGLAVVSGDLDAIRELIEHRRGGLLVPATADAGPLADALAAMRIDPTLRASLGHEARRRVEEEFDLRVNVDRLEAALERAALTARP